jgi:hypothetical protein
LDELQNQINKIKNSVRILWYIDKGEKTKEEKEQWLIENCVCKYHLMFKEEDLTPDYVKKALNNIKKFENSYAGLKTFGLKLSK